jgi:hypothetical protein
VTTVGQLRLVIAAGAAAIASLALAGPAAAGTDPLAGGSVQLSPVAPKGLKVSPRPATFQILGGDLDPVTGAGSVRVAGKLIFKRKGKPKRKAAVQVESFTFVPGGQGSVEAAVRGSSLPVFATISGGSVTREGLGAALSGISARLSGAGAKALSRAFTRKGEKRRKVKAGTLGTVSARTVPRTVEVVPGSGTMTLVADLALASKLMAHCINPVLPGGLEAVAPGTFSLLTSTFTFPVSGGSLAPDFSSGNIVTDGGQRLAKNDSLPVPFTCNEGVPAGTNIVQTNLTPDFGLSALQAGVSTNGQAVFPAAVGTLNLSAGSLQFDPATKQVTVTDVPVNLYEIAATVLNETFPNESGNPSNDFNSSDSLGMLSVTATLR